MQKRLKKTLLCVLALLTIICAAMSATVFATESLSLENATSFDGFVYGQTVSLPEGTLKYGADSKAATVTVEYPDGRKIGDSTLKLDVEGIYTVIYSGTFGGEEKTEKKTFTVKKDLYYVSGGSSSVTLNKTYKYKDHSSETVPDYGETPDATQSEIIAHMTNLIDSEVTGLAVSLSTGDTFSYGKVINLNDIPATNGKFEDIISLTVTPEKIGTKDVEDFSIILTDAYDPSNYITVNVKATVGEKVNSIVYARAAASNGQQLTGWAWNSTPAVKYVNNNYGTVTRMNFAGFNSYTATYNKTTANPTGINSDIKFGYDSIAKNVFSLAFDYANRAIYNYATSHSGKSDMIVDFDDPTHFEKLWSGFTTGECFLSIKGGTYVGSSFNFVINEIYGQDINSAAFDDRGNPDIKVAIDGYTEDNLPKAKVGTAYKVFDATCASPYYGALDVSVVVNDPDGSAVTLTDGKFTPAKTGVYTITYSVVDYLGKKTEKTLNVTAQETIPEISVTLNGEKQTAGIAGVYVTLVSDVTATGGSGNLKLAYTVKLGEENFEIKDGKFFPTRAGTYKVTVSATDYIGIVETAVYDVVVAAGDKPVYLDSPIIPKYFVSGKTYTLPALTAYDYTDGSGRAVKTKIAYIDGEGVKNAIGTTIVPVANAIKDTVTVIYYTNSYTAEGNIEFKDVPVVNAWNGNKVDVSKLFYGNGATVKSALNYTTVSASVDGETDFVNPLAVNGFSVTLKGKKGASFSAFTITLTDCENADRQVKFLYSPKDANKSYFRINDLTAIPYEAGQSISKGEDTIALKVDSSEWTVSYDKNSSSVIAIEKYLNGDKFEGFGDLVYVTFGFEGVDGSAAVDVYNVNDTALSSRTSDRSAPNISISGSYLGYYSKGAIVKIPKAIVNDVLDNNATGYVTVQSPENAEGQRSFVTSTDGIYLNKVSTDREYFINGTTCGAYLVTFYATDSTGNVNEYAYFINVMDEEAPVITVAEGSVTTGKVGEKIAIAKATATDAIDGEVKVTIHVATPSGMLYEVTETQTKFVANGAGLYKIIYTASDLSGNMAMKTIEITVS